MTSKQQFLPEKLSKFNSTMHSDSLIMIECQAKSRKYRGVFEVKSRVKTWQVRGIQIKDTNQTHS